MNLEKVDEFGSFSEGSIINIKYDVTDTITNLSDDNGDFVNTTQKDGTINFTLSPVTDGVNIDVNGKDNISTGTGDITTNDGTDGVEEVTINNTGTFTVTIDLNAISDTDGSESVTKLLISNVPDGIIVQDGIRVSGGSEATWIVDISDIAIDSATKTATITFDTETGMYNGTGTSKVITIESFAQDGIASEQTAQTQVKFIDNIDGGTTDKVEATLTIKDPDLSEDTKFTLADFIEVTPDSNDGQGDNSHDDAIYSISIKNMTNFSLVDESSMVSYTDSEGNKVYIISGDDSDINTKLGDIEVIPDANLNSNNSAGISADVVLNAYMSGAESSEYQESFSDTTITPITDDITSSAISITLDEDTTSSSFALTFDT